MYLNQVFKIVCECRRLQFRAMTFFIVVSLSPLLHVDIRFLAEASLAHMSSSPFICFEGKSAPLDWDLFRLKLCLRVEGSSYGQWLFSDLFLRDERLGLHLAFQHCFKRENDVLLPTAPLLILCWLVFQPFCMIGSPQIQNIRKKWYAIYNTSVQLPGRVSAVTK